MAGVRFFYTAKNKRFNYQPRYYDEQKEELENRIKRAKQELGLSEDDDTYIPNIKGQIRSGYRKKSRAARQKTGMRMIIILAILALIFYFLLYY